MPQMAPMWWEILYMMFITLFIMTNIILYWEMGSDVSVRQSGGSAMGYMNWKW